MTDQKDKAVPGEATEPSEGGALVATPLPTDPDLRQSQEMAPSRSIVDIVKNAVEETQEALRIASQLAATLNNDRVRAAHLLLALTLTPRGIERLGHYGMPKDTIRTSCWKELVPTDPPGDATRGPTISENVGDIIRRAQERADVRAFRISVDDIIMVINSTPLREPCLSP
jgi:hypothetical protein